MRPLNGFEDDCPFGKTLLRRDNQHLLYGSPAECQAEQCYESGTNPFATALLKERVDVAEIVAHAACAPAVHEMNQQDGDEAKSKPHDELGKRTGGLPSFAASRLGDHG